MTEEPDPIFAAGMAALTEAFNTGWNEALEEAATRLDERAEHLSGLMRRGHSNNAARKWQTERANIKGLARDIRNLVRSEAQHSGEGR